MSDCDMPASRPTGPSDFNPLPQRETQILTWLKSKEFVLLAIGVGLQIFVLVAMIAQRSRPLVEGKTVLLRVVPVDPRDMFRGDYVILGYDFSRVPPSGIDGRLDYQQGSQGSAGQTIYALLVPEADGKHWRCERFTASRPASGIFLRGTLRSWGRAEFGIESYYVQEGTGHKYEQAIRNHGLSAEVAVGRDGQAALRSLQIE